MLPNSVWLHRPLCSWWPRPGLNRHLRIMCPLLCPVELRSHVCPAGFSPVPRRELLLTGCSLCMLKRKGDHLRPLETHTGFEPARSDWKSDMLPLHQCAMWCAPVLQGAAFHAPAAFMARKKVSCGHSPGERSGIRTRCLRPVPAVALPKVPPARIAATARRQNAQSLGIFMFLRKSHIMLPFIYSSIFPV